MVRYAYHFLLLKQMLKQIFRTYSMHMFGMVAFIFTFSLGLVALFKDTENLAILLPYGILVFVLNLFYLKLMRLSRQDYENKLKKEKEYSQKLLKSQKLFLRYAIHETHTPLAIIMANIELFELVSGKHNILSNIEAATKNIYGIYDDLSYLTQKDKVVYPKQELVLADFIKSRIEFFDIVAKQSKLSFEFTNHCTQTTVKINETKLQRIIDNNITNAIKYTKEFEVIHIKLYENKKHYIFKISTNSATIEDPKQIFNAYYREDHSKDGLGLGLSLVKTICDEENIRIVLHSDNNNTSFKYYFNKEIQ